MTALVMLLLITIVALAATRSQTMESRMTVNTQNRNIARNTAEAGLRNGEAALADGLYSTAGFQADTSGLYQAWTATSACPQGSGAAPWYECTGSFWNTSGDLTTYGGDNAPALSNSGSSTTPVYIIESLPQVCTPKYSCTRQSTGATPPGLYRVTAYGTGGDTSSVVMLQSFYWH